MTDYFLLEVFTHDLTVPRELGGPIDEPSSPFALAFQFLDYPLLLTYTRPVTQYDDSATVLLYPAHTGKSCILQEDAEELQFVLEKVPLYVSLFHVNSMPSPNRPSLMASGNSPLFISQIQAQTSKTALSSGLQHAITRSIYLKDNNGKALAVARISCRLTNYGSQFPPPPPPQEHHQNNSLARSFDGPPALFFINQPHWESRSLAKKSHTEAGEVPEAKCIHPGSIQVPLIESQRWLQQHPQQLQCPSAHPLAAPPPQQQQILQMQQHEPSFVQQEKFQQQNHSQQYNVYSRQGDISQGHMEFNRFGQEGAAFIGGAIPPPSAKVPVRNNTEKTNNSKAQTPKKMVRIHTVLQSPTEKDDIAVAAAVAVLKERPPQQPLIKALLRSSVYQNEMETHKRSQRDKHPGEAGSRKGTTTKSNRSMHKQFSTSPSRRPFNASPPRRSINPSPPRRPSTTLTSYRQITSSPPRRPSTAAQIHLEKMQGSGKKQKSSSQHALSKPKNRTKAKAKGEATSREVEQQVQHHEQYQQPEIWFDDSARRNETDGLRDQGQFLNEGMDPSHHLPNPQEPSNLKTSTQAAQSVAPGLLYSKQQQQQKKTQTLPSQQQQAQVAAAMYGTGGLAPNEPWIPGGPPADARGIQAGFQMSSVLMWEMMNLVVMKSVLTSAMGAMTSQMTGFAQQMVSNAMQPLAGMQAVPVGSMMMPMQQQQQAMPQGYPILIPGPNGLVPMQPGMQGVSNIAPQIQQQNQQQQQQQQPINSKDPTEAWVEAHPPIVKRVTIGGTTAAFVSERKSSKVSASTHSVESVYSNDFVPEVKAPAPQAGGWVRGETKKTSIAPSIAESYAEDFDDAEEMSEKELPHPHTLKRFESSITTVSSVDSDPQQPVPIAAWGADRIEASRVFSVESGDCDDDLETEHQKSTVKYPPNISKPQHRSSESSSRTSSSKGKPSRQKAVASTTAPVRGSMTMEIDDELETSESEASYDARAKKVTPLVLQKKEELEEEDSGSSFFSDPESIEERKKSKPPSKSSGPPPKAAKASSSSSESLGLSTSSEEIHQAPASQTPKLVKPSSARRNAFYSEVNRSSLLTVDESFELDDASIAFSDEDIAAQLSMDHSVGPVKGKMKKQISKKLSQTTEEIDKFLDSDAEDEEEESSYYDSRGDFDEPPERYEGHRRAYGYGGGQY